MDQIWLFIQDRWLFIILVIVAAVIIYYGTNY